MGPMGLGGIHSAWAGGMLDAPSLMVKETKQRSVKESRTRFPVHLQETLHPPSASMLFEEGGGMKRQWQ